MCTPININWITATRLLLECWSVFINLRGAAAIRCVVRLVYRNHWRQIRIHQLDAVKLSRAVPYLVENASLLKFRRTGLIKLWAISFAWCVTFTRCSEGWIYFLTVLRLFSSFWRFWLLLVAGVNYFYVHGVEKAWIGLGCDFDVRVIQNDIILFIVSLIMAAAGHWANQIVILYMLMTIATRISDCLLFLQDLTFLNFTSIYAARTRPWLFLWILCQQLSSCISFLPILFGFALIWCDAIFFWRNLNLATPLKYFSSKAWALNLRGISPFFLLLFATLPGLLLFPRGDFACGRSIIAVLLLQLGRSKAREGALSEVVRVACWHPGQELELTLLGAFLYILVLEHGLVVNEVFQYVWISWLLLLPVSSKFAGHLPVRTTGSIQWLSQLPLSCTSAFEHLFLLRGNSRIHGELGSCAANFFIHWAVYLVQHA